MSKSHPASGMSTPCTHSGVGISAARSVPRQEFPKQHLTLDRADGCAGALSRRAAAATCGGSRPASLSFRPHRSEGRGVRCEDGGAYPHRADARGRRSHPSPQQRVEDDDVLDRCATHRASQRERMQPSARRPSGHWHAFRCGREGSKGSLLELSNGGKQPLAFPNGETRSFLQDGDEVIMTAFAEAPGFVRVGFGMPRHVVPAR